MTLRFLSAAMLLGSIPSSKMDLSGTWNFTGTLQSGGTGVVSKTDISFHRVHAATTANIADLASGAPATVDGYGVQVGDHIFVKDQTTPSTNGVYKVVTVGSGSDGAWSRDDDFDADAEVKVGMCFIPMNGTAGKGKIYMINLFAGDLGTDAIGINLYGEDLKSDREETTGDGSTLNFDLNYAMTEGWVVFVDGVEQPSSKYSVAAGAGSGGVDQLQFGSGNAPPNGLGVEVFYLYKANAS